MTGLAMLPRLALAGALVCLSTVLARAEIVIQDLTSPDGHGFWLVEEPSIPIVAVEMGFSGGSWLDPDGREGLARLTLSLLEEGAGDLDAVAFANRADEISARFGFGAGREQVTVSARFLLETLDESSTLLTLAMTEPRFDSEPVERLRRQMLSGVASREKDPDSIAARAWFDQAFPGHPYGRPSGGTRESLSAITVDDLRAMHRRLLTRTDVDIAIVGAIDADRAGALVDRLLKGLPEGEAIDVPQAQTAPPPGLTVFEEDVPQSVALLGHAGLPRSDPDFIAAYVMNYVLGGGGFSSRLTEEVREKRGLAYSVYSYLSPMDGAALHMAGVQTANARISESLDVIRTEWREMAEAGITADELARAKTYLTGSFPLRFDSNARIASYLVFVQRENLGRDYVNRRNGEIEAVTIDDVRRVAARLLDPDALSIVVVGKPEGL